MSAPLDRLAELIRAESGMELGDRAGALAAALARELPGVAAEDALSAAEGPGGPGLVRRLAEAVAVHETFFFRQREDLDAIDWRALLTTAHATGASAIRVWVAACSTGEEAYTLAMLASEALGSADPPVSILATDLSHAAVARASRGEYGPRSMRGVSAEQRARFFVPAGRGHRVGERLRRLVEFRQHNLVADPPPAPRFELVLCRNVLIYFGPATVERVLARLEPVVAPGGVLVLGAADRLCRPPTPTAARPGRPVQRRRRPSGPPTKALRPRRRRRPTEPHVGAAMAAADGGRLDDALAVAAAVLAEDPLDADAHFVAGIVELGLGDPAAAAESLRRALYVDPRFALAAFQLGRAHDGLGDGAAAARAYAQALRTLEPGHPRQQRLAPDIDLADIAAACGARIAALRGEAL